MVSTYNMENKVIKRETIKDSVVLEYKELSVVSLEVVLKMLRDNEATHFEMYAERDYDGCIESVEFIGLKLQLESDEELEIRRKKLLEAEDKKRLEKISQIENAERDLLRKLKEKYEK